MHTEEAGWPRLSFAVSKRDYLRPVVSDSFDPLLPSLKGCHATMISFFSGPIMPLSSRAYSSDADGGTI